jgi:hypothetical protein
MSSEPSTVAMGTNWPGFASRAGARGRLGP